MKPSHLKKSRIALLVAGCFAIPQASAAIVSYPGDPGAAGDPASWRTAEFNRDWGLRAIGAEFAYAAGYAGGTINIGIVDSGYFGGHTVELPSPRYTAVTGTGGTTGPTPGFYNQAFNNSHGTHVSGTVGASRDGAPAATNMQGVAFNANVFVANTHKTDAVYYGLQPANVTDALKLDNAYIGNLYTILNTQTPTANGSPIRIITSSWGSQPSTENYNTYDGITTAWRYLITPNGVADANGNTDHWIHGAIAAARSGTIVQFTAGNSGYNNTTARASATYYLPDLEGHFYTTTGISLTGQTLNADGSVLVPGTQLYNRCGIAKWACISAPGSNINSTTVTVTGGVPTATYGSSSGTSMAGPHSAAALALIMERFSYMTNEQALYTMFTTARQNATISDPNNISNAIANPTRGQMVDVPDIRNGWGTVSLRDAMNGPGQFLGNFAVNTRGQNDTWSNNISDNAFQARRIEDAAEAVAWEATKVAKGWVNGLPPNASDIDKSDYEIGMARQTAREARVYDGSLTKLGSGVLSLSGNNTYRGGTEVDGGWLVALAGHALGTGDVDVAGGGLATRSRDTVQIGGDFTLTSNSILDLGFYNAAIKPLTIAGSANFNGLLFVSFLDSVLSNSLGVYDIIGVTDYHGTFSSFSFSGLGGGLWARVQYTVNGVQVAVVVPEPGSYALLFAGLGVMAWSIRRRQRA